MSATLRHRPRDDVRWGGRFFVRDPSLVLVPYDVPARAWHGMAQSGDRRTVKKMVVVAWRRLLPLAPYGNPREDPEGSMASRLSMWEWESCHFAGGVPPTGRERPDRKTPCLSFSTMIGRYRMYNGAARQIADPRLLTFDVSQSPPVSDVDSDGASALVLLYTELKLHSERPVKSDVFGSGIAPRRSRLAPRSRQLFPWCTCSPARPNKADRQTYGPRPLLEHFLLHRCFLAPFISYIRAVLERRPSLFGRKYPAQSSLCASGPHPRSPRFMTTTASAELPCHA